jgi:hypothetical protein
LTSALGGQRIAAVLAYGGGGDITALEIVLVVALGVAVITIIAAGIYVGTRLARRRN